MTPEQYIAYLGELMDAERYQDALDASVALRPAIQPPLSLEEFGRVSGMMEIAATIVSLDAAEARQEDRVRDATGVSRATAGAD